MASKRIAFFLFLGPDDWEAEDGGALELFNVTQQFQPSAVGHRIHPKLNTLVILETTPNTFYQVNRISTYFNCLDIGSISKG
jgi:Rps23 Pro-64 3,4-dihydroxylase Tpa1-like proline 4-hydroxylase